MTIPPSFWSLPTEILRFITLNLTSKDLTQLAVVCKSINAIVDPLLWTGIELHGQGYHDSSAELNIPPPFICPSQRSELASEQMLSHGSNEAALKLFKMLQSLEEDRAKQLASRVKHLCAAIDPAWFDGDDEDQIWQLLPYFTNLETLELHGQMSDPDSESELAAELSAPPLSKIRFVKLSGFIPRKLAAWVLRSGSLLERLELGMLDRPISGSASYERRFRPLPEDDVNFGRNAGDEDEDMESDYGSLDEENVIPRPLSRFLPHGGDENDEEKEARSASLTLTKLKHLYLYQPGRYDDPEGIEYSWSTRADQAALADWKEILLACSSTLETLVLEQRPGAEETEMEGWETNQFMATRNKEPQDAGSRLLVNMLTDVIRKDGAFPELKHVYFYGIPVGTEDGGLPLIGASGGRFMHMLKERGVNCQARLGKWCSFTYDDGIAHWTWWSPDDDAQVSAPEEFGSWDKLLAEV